MKKLEGDKTPEGLTVVCELVSPGRRRIREVGFEDEVIFEYFENADPLEDDDDLEAWSSDICDRVPSLVRKLHQLSKKCRELKRDNPNSLEHAQSRRNRKMAAKRLRRLLREECIDRDLEIPGQTLDLVRETLRSGVTDPPPDLSDPSKFYEDGTIGILIDYLQRRWEYFIPLLVASSA